MMLPILISLSVAPGSYFFSVATAFVPTQRPRRVASKIPHVCDMSTSLCRQLVSEHMAVWGFVQIYRLRLVALRDISRRRAISVANEAYRKLTGSLLQRIRSS